jgi:tetratricopeptide (TPR) repeat protein
MPCFTIFRISEYGGINMTDLANTANLNKTIDALLDSAERYLEQSDILCVAGQKGAYDKAEILVDACQRICTVVLQYEKNSARAFAILGDTYTIEQNWRAAENAYTNALARGGETASLLLKRGAALAAQQKYFLALDDFEEAVRHNSTQYLAWLGKAQCEAETGNLQAAIADYGKAIIRSGLEPGTLDIFLKLASVYISLDDQHREQDCYKAILSLSENPAHKLNKEDSICIKVATERRRT